MPAALAELQAEEPTVVSLSRAGRQTLFHVTPLDWCNLLAVADSKEIRSFLQLLRVPQVSATSAKWCEDIVGKLASLL